MDATSSPEPEPEPDTQPIATPAAHHDLPLEVLEDDETIPPRPEESVADASPGV